MNKDKKYRRKKKEAQLGMETENNILKAKNKELGSEIEQLKSDKVGLEKEVLKLEAQVQKQTYEGEIKALKLESNIKDLKALVEKEKAEKKYIQKELDNANQKLVELTERHLFDDNPFLFPIDGSLRQGMSDPPPKLAQGWATRINSSTKLPPLIAREEFPNSICYSVRSLFEYLTKMGAKRRVDRDDCFLPTFSLRYRRFGRIDALYNWEKEIHRIENLCEKLCILNSHSEPPRKLGSNWVLESLIRKEICRTLLSCCVPLEGKYKESIAFARRIRDSTILQSYAGNLDCKLIDLGLDDQLYAFSWWSFNRNLLRSRSIEILHSIGRYAESLRVVKKPWHIMQLSFASPIEMRYGILQCFYKLRRKSGVWNLHKLRSSRRLLVVTRRMVLRIKKLRTLRCHSDPPKGRGDLVILVKNSARSVWKFRCASQATRKPVIVGDLVDDQIVFYEGDLPTGAHYRSEIAIVGLGLATWVELESSG